MPHHHELHRGLPQGPEPGARHRANQAATAAPLVLSAYVLFYPAAALYGALVLPASVLWHPAWHPGEMLFGFALAVVAGNQLGPVRASRLYLMFGLWAAARVAALTLTPSIALVFNAAFALALAAQVAPRLLRAAKKWRNRALPVVLIALCIAVAAVRIHAVVLLLAMLMLFMGGRIIPPAVAGQLERQGIRLVSRVQPRLEGALLVSMALSLLWTPFSVLAGALAGVRLARWRLWRLRGRPDLLCLASGYAWLALGLAAYGLAYAYPQYRTAAVHLITVGALGTLTFNVMALSWLLKARRDPAEATLIVTGTAFLAAATVARVLDSYLVAALCWSAAFTLLLVLFLRTSRIRI